jgi:hypothetical protein
MFDVPLARPRRQRRTACDSRVSGPARLARRVECKTFVVHIARFDVDADRECRMDELNGRMMACQILITGLIARVANESPDPLRFLTDFRDEIRAVVKGVNISGMENTERVRQVAQSTVDELFSLMKPPSSDE